MIDLNNLHGGRKLIKQIVEKTTNNKKPWSREQQQKKVANQKNIKPKAK
jgi:hypothetical protein